MEEISAKEFVRIYRTLDAEQRRCIRRVRALNKSTASKRTAPDLPLHFPSSLSYPAD